MASEYTRGDMDVSEHRRVYSGVMSVGLTGGLLTGLIVFYLAVVFGTAAGWFSALIAAGVVGGLLGVALKQKTLYWTVLVVMGLITLLAGFFVSVFSGPVA